MFGQIFGSVEVMSSIVLGGATLGAACLNLFHEGRKAKRSARETGVGSRWLRRPLIVLVLAVAGVGGWFAYAAGAFERIGLRAPSFAQGMRASDPIAQQVPAPVERIGSDVVEPGPAGASAAEVARPASAPHAARGHEDWLQSEGTKLYYRFSRYLPDACPGNPIAIGNWTDGETRPVLAICVDQDWLALDVAPMVADGRITPNLTYCLNFRSESGVWGLHAPEQAPGLDSIAVPAARVPLGRAIGVRYIKGLRERIVPTAEPPRAEC